MSDLIMCGPCGYAESDKDADNWCTVCEEGLCTDCEKVHKSIKTTRTHMLISTEDYRQIEHISVRLNCEDHDKRFELYCKTHGVAVCLGCVPTHHRTCTDVIPLDKAAANAKQSTALADLEDTLTLTIQNIEQIIADRDSASKKLEYQKKTIKNTINATRQRIMKKLDDIEHKILFELDIKHGEYKSKESKLLTSLKKSERDLICLREQTSQLKSFASDIQLFLGTRQINETVFKKVESVKESIMSVQNYEVYIQLHPSVMALMNEVDQLGEIFIKKTTINSPFKEATVDRAQIQLTVQEMKSIDNIQFKLRKTVNVGKKNTSMWLTGCTMLSNGNVLIADYSGKNFIMEYSEDDEHIRDIACTNEPFDFTVMGSDHIAISYGDSKYIEILDMKNATVRSIYVQFNGGCYGISYQDNKLFINMDGIVITNITGKVLKKLIINWQDNTLRLYLKTTKDKIYYTSNSTVTCISMLGEKIWKHTVKSSVRLRGITVDDHENVYVTDEQSNTVIAIQHDGQSRRHVLTKSDGLCSPNALHYNIDENLLLVCNISGSAMLYNLIE